MAFMTACAQALGSLSSSNAAHMRRARGQVMQPCPTRWPSRRGCPRPAGSAMLQWLTRRLCASRRGCPHSAGPEIPRGPYRRLGKILPGGVAWGAEVPCPTTETVGPWSTAQLRWSGETLAWQPRGTRSVCAGYVLREDAQQVIANSVFYRVLVHLRYDETLYPKHVQGRTRSNTAVD